jgi:hypothetical protein
VILNRSLNDRVENVQIGCSGVLRHNKLGKSYAETYGRAYEAAGRSSSWRTLKESV